MLACIRHKVWTSDCVESSHSRYARLKLKKRHANQPHILYIINILPVSTILQSVDSFPLTLPFAVLCRQLHRIFATRISHAHIRSRWFVRLNIHISCASMFLAVARYVSHYYNNISDSLHNSLLLNFQL